MSTKAERVPSASEQQGGFVGLLLTMITDAARNYQDADAAAEGCCAKSATECSDICETTQKPSSGQPSTSVTGQCEG